MAGKQVYASPGRTGTDRQDRRPRFSGGPKRNRRILQLALFEDKTMLEYRKPGATTVSFYEDKGFMADSNVFQFFTYPFIEGDPNTALREPSTIVLSEEIAHKLFGNGPALNKMIHVSSGTNGDNDMTVTGVFRPVDGPSHLQANFFLSFRGGYVEQIMKQGENDFASNNMFTAYVRLRPGSKPAGVEAKFPAFLDKYAGKDMKAYGLQKRQFLVPVREIHLRGDVPTNVTPAGQQDLPVYPRVDRGFYAADRDH